MKQKKLQAPAGSAFYISSVGCLSYENEFYLMMHTPDKSSEISLLNPKHPCQQPIFQNAFNGKDVYFTIEVEDIDKLYAKIKAKNSNRG